MSDIIDKVHQAINDAIDNNELLLPTMPEVALKVREATSDPEVSVKELSKVIAQDAALSARIIRVSNSPLLRASNPITDLNMAVSRLGLEYTANLATGLAMEQMFQATSDVVDQYLRNVWKTSLEVAGISLVLCRHFTNLKPDQAMLGGLVHQIGILPILTFVEKHRKLLKDPNLLKQIIERIHQPIGERILKTWDFSDELLVIPNEYLNLEREADYADYADVVMIASLQNKINNQAMSIDDIDVDSISALGRLGMEKDMLINHSEDLSDEMEAAMLMLNS